MYQEAREKTYNIKYICYIFYYFKFYLNKVITKYVNINKVSPL